MRPTLVLALCVAVCGMVSRPEGSVASLSFRADRVRHELSGSLTPAAGSLEQGFVAARADSVGGFVVVATS